MVRTLLFLLCFAFSPVIAGEPSMAEKLFQFHYQAAMGDNPESMYILANMYENGRGTRVDYDEAIKWYSRAARYGNTLAATKLQKVLAKKQTLPDKAEQSRDRPHKASRRKSQQPIQQQPQQSSQEKTRTEQKVPQHIRDAKILQQNLEAQKHAADRAKADAERAALLLQRQLDLVKKQSENAKSEAEKIRRQKEQLEREKAELEKMQQSLQAKEEQLSAQKEHVETNTQPNQEEAVKHFKADPCDGPGARFMSTCR